MNYPGDPPLNPNKKQTMYAPTTARLAKFTEIITHSHFSAELFGSDIACDPRAIEDLQLACEIIITLYAAI